MYQKLSLQYLKALRKTLYDTILRLLKRLLLRSLDTIYKKVESLGLRANVIFTDYVSESDKSALIAGAKLFVLPSFWEGFGLDALNSMASGVPVVVSNVGSLPEVVGDAGILVDPYNIN